MDSVSESGIVEGPVMVSKGTSRIFLGATIPPEIRKSMDSRVRDLPVIALTASAYLTEKEKAKLFGMDDHVGKPFGPEDLLDKISYHLKNKIGVRG